MDSNYGTYSSQTATVDPHAAGAALAVIIGIMFFLMIFLLIVYIYMSYCRFRIAKKVNAENCWLAWIPLFNYILLLQITKKPLWWFILLFIPIANIVIVIITWMELSKVLKKPEWLGILMIVPIANLVVPGYLAFSNSETPSQPTATPPPAAPIA